MHTMMLKRLFALIALLSVLVASIGFAASATAGVPEPTPPPGASGFATACRAHDETGLLDQIGLTRGECVALLSGQSSEHLSRYLAGVCGAEVIQALYGTTTKGQCIRVVSEVLEEAVP
jgi:hypothetical protein